MIPPSTRTPIGEDCAEVALAAEVSAEDVAELVSRLDAALAERRHVLLNAGGCRRLSPEALAAIAEARERFASAGLDVLAFGGSGPVRYLLDAALDEPTEAPRGREPIGPRRFLRPAPEAT